MKGKKRGRLGDGETGRRWENENKGAGNWETKNQDESVRISVPELVEGQTEEQIANEEQSKIEN
jgi:hypothetical protein